MINQSFNKNDTQNPSPDKQRERRDILNEQDYLKYRLDDQIKWYSKDRRFNHKGYGLCGV